MVEQPLEVAAEEVVQENSVTVEEVKQATDKGENPAEPNEEAAVEPEKEETADELKARMEKMEQKFQKRIGKKTATAKALEEKTLRLEQEVEKLRQAQQPVDDTPNEDDYDTFEEYQDAVVEHRANKKAEERLHKAKEEELQRAKQSQLVEKQKNFTERQNEMREAYPDFDEVASEVEETIADLTNRGADIKAFAEAVLDLDNGVAILYELHKNDSLEEVATMSPMAMMRELVRTELGLKPVERREDRTAPAPIKPVTPKGSKPIGQKSAADVLKWAKT